MTGHLERPAKVHSTWVRLPAFAPDIHAAFRRAHINCYRVPAYTREPTDARLELEARHEFEALARIRVALAGVDVYGFHPTRDVIHWPWARGGEMFGDGEPDRSLESLVAPRW